jgi:hypothetical protein
MAPTRPAGAAPSGAKAQTKSAPQQPDNFLDDLNDLDLDDIGLDMGEPDDIPALQPAKATKPAKAAKLAKGDKADKAAKPTKAEAPVEAPAKASKGAAPEKGKGKGEAAPKAATNPKLYLSIALAVSAVMWFIPFSDWALYPVRLLVTFFHEAGHALATFLTFGSVKSLVVNPNGSGMVTSTGGVRFLISSAGYLGTTLLGAALVLLSRHAGRVPSTLTALGVGSITCTVLWAGYLPTWPVALALGLVLTPLYLMHRDAAGGDKLAKLVPQWLVARRKQLQMAAAAVGFGAAIYLGVTGALLTMIVGAGGGAALIWLGRRAPLGVAQFTLAFLAVQVSFNALEDLRTLFGLSVSSPHVHTDAQNMAREFFLPAAFWASIWAVLAVLIVGAALWRFYDLPLPAFLRRGKAPKQLEASS